MLENLTPAERATRLAIGRAERDLEKQLAAQAHRSIMSKKVGKRVVTRETIHAQKERADLRAAFRLFGF